MPDRPENTPEVTGRTRVLGILAHPTDHVKAPPKINRIARERGSDAIMVPMNVAPENFEGFVNSLRTVLSFDGAIVTVPFKQAILPLCDELSEQAAAVGAANVIRRLADGRLVGDQLDGVGFLRGLEHAGIQVAGRSVYLVGAGGAANAVAFALAQAGIGRLTLANRSQHKSDELRERLLRHYPTLAVSLGTQDPSGHQLIINGTSLGMQATDPLPLDVTRLTPQMTVAEVVQEPERTALLVAAENVGCRVHLGRHMLEHQVQLMADFLGL
ncbi:shikimate dehydrogenase [Pseudomonas yamanorum]|jgi:shikimate dehydrogenase|uniref:shikimate dehydrogenase family protein n=1 Tax=Pseudomonas TaxID=286 RepID=UPI0015A35A8E|nr:MULTISPECIES: shikimate dehydrogenase [Pseudomonas]MCS3416490.1 shikimate dehydrogenase [Pseudomonas sp. BIGb0558]MCS3435725.1 shikimate dehydrogenase [Pseudomonas sp. BIGb0450]NWE41445.1 shikimate dehydrogenase [Pseudomonas yamanorum]